MSEVLIATVYFVFLLLAVFLGLRSLQRLVALRREGREVKDFYENELAREIREAIVGEIHKAKTAPEGVAGERPKSSDALSGLLLEIYDDLYTRIVEEEATRKKSLEELKVELERLRSEMKNQK